MESRAGCVSRVPSLKQLRIPKRYQADSLPSTRSSTMCYLHGYLTDYDLNANHCQSNIGSQLTGVRLCLTPEITSQLDPRQLPGSRGGNLYLPCW